MGFQMYKVDWYSQPLGGQTRIINTTTYNSLEEAEKYIENFWDIMDDPERGYIFEYAKERNVRPGIPIEVKDNEKT
jgi:hypothetical protein